VSPLTAGPTGPAEVIHAAAVSVTGVELLAVSTALEAVGGFLVLAVGYGACFALWHFVFSPRNSHDDDLDRARSEEFLE